jgi:hypothetical protein
MYIDSFFSVAVWLNEDNLFPLKNPNSRPWWVDYEVAVKRQEPVMFVSLPLDSPPISQ